MRSLVIGADGFVGRWLCAHLLESGDRVSGIVGPRYATPVNGIDEAIKVDVRDVDQVRAVVGETRPEAVYYLAGVSTRGDRDALNNAAGVTVIGALGVLMAAAGLKAPPRILYVSTGLVYAGGDEPRTEDSPVAPHGMYAAAKYAGEVALGQLAEASGVEVVIARAFNHIGPGQSEAFVVPTIARQVVRLGELDRPVVRLAIGQVVRDFCDVRDVVRAYRLLAATAPSGTYNIGSGEGISIKELAQLMLAVGGIPAEIEVENEDATGQPLSLVANVGKVQGLGWHRQYDLRDSVRAVLDEHRVARSH